jgi:hypothetical protein
MSVSIAGSGSPRRYKLWIFCLIVVAYFIYLYDSRARFDKGNIITESYLDKCLDSSSKITDHDFELHCEGRSFIVTAYPEKCTFSKSCELSLVNPISSSFDRSSRFEVDLVRELQYTDKKLKVYGFVIGRGFFGKVEADITKQEVVPLNDVEVAAMDQYYMPKKDPMVAARELRLEAKTDDNRKMMDYAEKNHSELSRKARKFVVDSDAVLGMAEWRYYMKNGKIVSCLRGFQGDTFMYDCSSH